MARRGKLKLIDRDLGYRRIVAELRRATNGGAYAKVGILGGTEERDGGVSAVELGTIHEFGAPAAGIPERSFLRRTFDRKKDEWYALTRQLCSLLYGGRITMSKALGLLGARAAADMKATITDGPEIPPPPKPETLRRKQGLTQRLASDAARQAEARYEARTRKREGPMTAAQHAASEGRKFAAAGKAAARITQRRGTPRNLVDTGRLVGSITWKVVVGPESPVEGEGRTSGGGGER